MTIAAQFIVAPVFGQVPQMVPNRPEWWRNGASLELDFLRNRYMVSTTTAVVSGTSLTAFLNDASGTFTRNTTATYFDADGVMRTAAANEPRLDHDPLTGEPLGYLTELGVTNHITQSSNLAAWTVSGSADLPLHTPAPDAGTAYSISSSTPLAGVWQNMPQLTDAASLTVSIFVRNVSGSGAIVVGNDVASQVAGGPALLAFNTSTGSITSATPAISWQKVQPMLNGWYRLSFAYTTSGTVGRMMASHGDASWGENAFWGAQVERLFFAASSYIPTTTAKEIRGTDFLRFADTIATGWSNPAGDGTIYVSGVIYEGSRNDSTGSYWPGMFNLSQDSDGGNTVMQRTNYAPNFNWYTQVLINNATRFSSGIGGGCDGTVHQSKNRTLMAVAFQTGNYRGACSGILDAGSTYAGMPLPLFNDLRLGRNRVHYMIGHLRHFTYFPYRAPDPFLQEITTYPGD